MAHAGTTFITELFAHTGAPIYFCSLPNVKGDDSQAGETFYRTRDMASVERHISRFDVDGRGYYYCVSTIANGQRRLKTTCVETPALIIDSDYKTIVDDEVTAIGKLKKLRMPPSFINKSGHGLHTGWIFKEALRTVEHTERIEAALKLLADVIGGDYEPTHIAALMRLPGTHNSKGGGARQVCEVVWTSGHRYELSDIEEWISEQSPVILRRNKPERPSVADHFARHGDAFGFKPSTDITARLSAMEYQGVGDAAIHSTQLAVTSSLLSRGEDVAQTIAMVLEATRVAAGDYGKHWNWQREEKIIRGMCDSWQKKIEISPKPQKQISRSAASEAAGNVLSLALARQAKTEQAQQESASKYAKLGGAVLQAIRDRGDDIMHSKSGAIYAYQDKLWQMQSAADHKSLLLHEIENACRAGGIKSSIRWLSETREWIMREPSLWRDEPAWDRHGKVPVRTGLIDPQTRQLIPAQPTQFATWRVPFDYDPNATCPLFDQLLTTTFGNREDQECSAIIDTFWQWLGSGLLDSRPRGMRKVLVLWGGTDSGKSVLLDIALALFGGRAISTSFDELDRAHGTWPFRERLPWILPEAFTPEKWHPSAIVKALVTGDVFSINPKNGVPVTMRYNAPILWASNVPPQFRDPTEATVNRLIVINCRQRFDEQNPVGVAKLALARGFAGPAEMIVASELPGILNGALAGLARAWEGAAIAVPSEARETANDILASANAMRGFVADYCAFDPGMMIGWPDFRVAFNAHREDQGLEPMTQEAINRALTALNDPRVVFNKTELRLGVVRYFCGLLLNSEGELLRKRAVESAAFERRPISHVADAASLASRPIPDGTRGKEIDWRRKKPILALVLAHQAGGTA